jgi:hypothetical protein
VLPSLRRQDVGPLLRALAGSEYCNQCYYGASFGGPCPGLSIPTPTEPGCLFVCSSLAGCGKIGDGRSILALHMHSIRGDVFLVVDAEILVALSSVVIEFT